MRAPARELAHWGCKRMCLWGTICVMPERAEARIRTLPLEPWVEFPAGSDPCEAFAEMGLGPACDFASSGRKWSALWGTIRVRGVPNWARALANLPELP